MNKKNDPNRDENGKRKKGSPKIPGSGRSISPKPGKVDLDKVLKELMEFEIPEDILEDFDKGTLGYELLRYELKFLCMKKIGIAGLQMVSQMIGQIDEHMVRRLLEAMRTRRLTPEEVEALEFYLNEKAIDGSPIWLSDPPQEIIGRGGEKL